MNFCRAFLVVGALLFATNAHAGRHPADAFAGKVITAKKRLPMSAKSKAAYIKKVKKLKKKQFVEDKEKQRWKIYFSAFFRRPLNDLEVTVKLWDVTQNGPKKLLASFEQYLSKPGERILNSTLVLKREMVGVNKRVLMEVVNRGRVLASTHFDLIGEAEKFSGEADFTKSE